MMMTPTGGYVLPTQTVYDRKVAKGRREHFTGSIVVGDNGDERILDVESHTEMQVALVLLARSDVVALDNQVPFRWTKPNGQPATHFFDFRAYLRDGSRIAVMVKSARRLQHPKVRREIEQIAVHVTDDFADRVVVMTEEHLDPVETHNACLIHDMRKSEPYVDSVARRAIRDLAGRVSIGDLQNEIGQGGSGFGAIVRLLSRGELELVTKERITHEALVQRKAS